MAVSKSSRAANKSHQVARSVLTPLAGGVFNQNFKDAPLEFQTDVVASRPDERGPYEEESAAAVLKNFEFQVSPHL